MIAMNHATLTDRYVAAVLSAVPESQRADVGAELRASIADAMEDRINEGLDPAKAEDEVIRDLGDPARLAAGYTGRPRYLIGPEFFDEYTRLLRLLLLIVVPAVGGAMVLAQALAGAGPIQVIGGALGVVFQVGVQLTFWVTVVFVVLERTRTHPRGLTEEWSPADLPEVVERRIGIVDTVWSIAMLVLLIWMALWQRDHWLVLTPQGESLPVLNPALWDFWFPVLLGILAASIVLDVAKYRIGHWTVPLASCNTALNVLFAGLVIWLWSTQSVLNPAFTAGLQEGVMVLMNVAPWIVAVICLVDTIDGWRHVSKGGLVPEDH